MLIPPECENLTTRLEKIKWKFMKFLKKSFYCVKYEKINNIHSKNSLLNCVCKNNQLVLIFRLLKDMLTIAGS